MRASIPVMLSIALWAGLGGPPGAPFAAPPAFAQPGAPSQEEMEKASRLYKDAESHYNLREYEKALALFRESYLLSHEPALLLNMGQCYRFLERYDDALLTYEVYLREDPGSSYRGDVEALIVEMKALSAKRSEETAPTDTPPDAQLSPALSPPTLRPPGGDLSDAGSKKPSLIFYGVAGGAGALGVILGGAALASLSESRQLFGEDRVKSEELFRRARLLGVVCDVSLVASLMSGTVGYLKARQRKKASAALAGGR